MWDWNFALSILPEILSTLNITIFATVFGFIFALVFGLILTVMRRSRFQVLVLFASGFIEFIRTTPLLVQLYFIFYVFPTFGLTLSPLAAGVVGLGIHYSTYLSEVYRGGIDAIEEGQWEVAKALNFTPKQCWVKIILPQAIPPIIPVIGNYFITMFKETPLLSAITLVEILQKAKIIGSQSFRYIEGFAIVGILFFILSYPSSQLIKRLELRLNNKF